MIILLISSLCLHKILRFLDNWKIANIGLNHQPRKDNFQLILLASSLLIKDVRCYFKRAFKMDLHHHSQRKVPLFLIPPVRYCLLSYNRINSFLFHLYFFISFCSRRFNKSSSFYSAFESVRHTHRLIFYLLFLCEPRYRDEESLEAARRKRGKLNLATRQK